MSKKKKKSFRLNDVTEEFLNKLFIRQRIRVLSKFVDKEFVENPEFISKIEKFMDGNIRNEIMSGLDGEYAILRDDPNDENINKMVDEKVINFIKKIYPQKNF